MKKMKKLIVLTLTISVFLSACGQTQREINSQEESTTTQTVTAKQMADQIRSKYQGEDIYDYAKPKINVSRDEEFQEKLGFDLADGKFQKFSELVDVYQDSGLTQSISAHYEWDSDTKTLTIAPPLSEPGSIFTTGVETDAPGNDGTSATLFDKGEKKDWGNLSEYYMVQYVDFNTGEKLAKPIVTVFTVKHEIESAPKVSMKLNKQGLPEFSWKKVKGASSYYIMTIPYSKDRGFTGGGTVLGSTKETTWSPQDATYFRIYDVSEAERSEQANIDQYGEGTDPILSDTGMDNYYCVIAVRDTGTSQISNTFATSDLAKQIPYTQEVKKSTQNGESDYADGVLNLPAYKWITMCDGKLVQRLVTYDYDKAKTTTETWADYEKEDMSDLKTKEVDVVEIPYTIEGTGFHGTGIVQNYVKDTLQNDLKALKERQEGLKNKAGTQKVDLSTQQTGKESNLTKTTNLQESNYKVTASNALVEYLAMNMLQGNECIDLTSFPESFDQSKLTDDWQEAVYQNPLILGVKSASISSDGTSMYVEYDTDAQTMLKKQREIEKEVSKVVHQIITNDMSQRDKEMAINKYICDTAQYDEAALDDAQKNDYESVDEKYDDSFTPYGVLINKVGVCASYAGSFKLLADAAGLNTIIVTGYLDGDCPHEWNKVEIDGQWQIVDSTNNDNDQISNALLNLSNRAADKVLMEDDKYMVDSEISKYVAPETPNEYYHVENKFYDESEISTALSKELTSNAKTVLRTNYDMNDDEFHDIGQEVLNQTGMSQMSGFYWMGVVYLTKSADQ